MQCANVPTWELNRYRRQRRWTTDDVILQAIKDVCMEPPPDAHLGCFGGKKIGVVFSPATTDRNIRVKKVP